MKLTKVLALMTAFGLSIVGANADTGIFGSYIQIGSTWYGMSEWGNDVQNFQGANLGSFNVGASETISDFEIHTFKNGDNNTGTGNDVTGAEYQWRVYSGAPGAFTVVSQGFTANSPFTGDANGSITAGGGDQSWSTPASQPNFLNGLIAGTYSMEVFSRATTQGGATTEVFSNNGGANYIASFTVVPEPATLALFGIGIASLAVARRRRA